MVLKISFLNFIHILGGCGPNMTLQNTEIYLCRNTEPSTYMVIIFAKKAWSVRAWTLKERKFSLVCVDWNLLEGTLGLRIKQISPENFLPEVPAGVSQNPRSFTGLVLDTLVFSHFWEVIFTEIPWLPWALRWFWKSPRVRRTAWGDFRNSRMGDGGLGKSLVKNQNFVYILLISTHNTRHCN